ncbi:TonB-dependent receptor domain-containing protein [Proteus mirabilis]|uniref:TonB-dependent receptor domain-containing protein n=1 Tax=Proteus mirabilis TaxID=584 RepID=UPI0034E56D5B
MDINGMSMLKRNFKYSTLATAICLLYAPTTFAHIEKVETDTLTVIGQQDNQITDFQSVVDTRSAQAQNASTTGQLLKQIPGITVSGTGIANGANIMMRGYDQKGVKIFVDGIHQPLENTMNKLGGIFLEPSLINRVNVKHGASSTLHGDGAMGGVVSFYTLDPSSILSSDKRLGAKIFSSTSSADRHFAYGGIIAARHNIAEGLFAYSQRQRGPLLLANGEKMENHEHIKNFFAKAYVYPTENQTLLFSARHYSNAGKQREVLHRMKGHGKHTSNQMQRETLQKNYSVTHHYASDTNTWLDLTTYIYYSQFNINQTYLTDSKLTASDLRNNVQGKIGTFESRTQSTYGVKLEDYAKINWLDTFDQSLMIGTEVYQQKMVSNETAKNFPLAKINYVAGWVRSSLSTPILPLTLTTGIRYHYYKNIPGKELNSFFKRFSSKELQVKKHASNYQGIAENITLTYSPTNWLQLYSTYSTSSRAPTLSEMFNDSFHFKFLIFNSYWVPNPDLQPEKNSMWEHGANFSFQHILSQHDRLSLKLAYFDTESIDYITYRPWNERSLAGKISLQAFNIPKALIEGADLSLHYFHPLITIGLSYNRTHTLELTTHETISPVRPEVLTTFIEFPIPKIPLSLGWSGKFASSTENKGTHTGRAPHVRGKNTNRLEELIEQYPGYGIHDFSISYQSQNNKDIQATLVLSNAFNREYYSALGVPQEGRNIKMSVSYRW